MLIMTERESVPDESNLHTTLLDTVGVCDRITSFRKIRLPNFTVFAYLKQFSLKFADRLSWTSQRFEDCTLKILLPVFTNLFSVL